MRTAKGTAAIVGAAIAAGAMVLSFRPIYEPDLWWHLAQGRETVAGRLVRANAFSFNYPDYRQRYTPWLFDASAYLSWVAGGAVAIQVLQACLLALTLLFLYVACRIRGPASSAAAVLIIGFFVLEPRAIPRPHLVSFAALAACTYLVQQAVSRRSAAPLWWAVPLVALWSNAHVECVFAVMLIGLFSASELVRPSALPRREAIRAALVAAACLIATMANPYGWGLLAYLYENWSVPQILTIAELLPPPLVTYRAFYAYLIVCAALLAWQWRRLELWELVTAVAFAALGLRFLRLTPLVLLVTAPMLTARLARLALSTSSGRAPSTSSGRAPSTSSGQASRRNRNRALIFGAICVGLLISRIPPRVLVTQLAAGADAVAPRAFFSESGMAFAQRAGLQGPVFNSHNLGGYIAWMLYPKAQVFQDSRLQAYPPEHFLSILVASRSQPDWDVLVADVDWAVLSLPRPNQLSGVGRFPAQDWAVIFRDEAIEIVVRRSGRFGGIANR